MTWTLYPIAQLANSATQWHTLAQSRRGTPCFKTAILQAAIDTFGSGNDLLRLLNQRAAMRPSALQPATTAETNHA